MATETLGFTVKHERDDLYTKWKNEGSKGLAKYSSHQGNDPAIIWVVSRTEPIETAVKSPVPVVEEPVEFRDGHA